MNRKNGSTIVSGRLRSIDWKLLVFLLLFLNVKLIIKVAAVILIYALRPGLKFGFRLKNSRLPLFYILAIGIALCNWFISGQLTNLYYGLVVATGIVFWILCILAMHQVKLAVEQNDPPVIHQTIAVFFIINAVVSLAVYAGIIIETGHFNPYRYQGDFQKYFIGTGDYIKGVTLDTSTTNAILNGFGVIYFLLRGKNFLAILCMAVLLFTGSNFTNLLLSGTLLFIFIFQSSKAQKSMVVVCLAMLVVFLAKISPQNNHYIVDAWEKFLDKGYSVNFATYLPVRITERPDSTLNDAEKKQKTAQLYLDSINRSMLEHETAGMPAKTGPVALPRLVEKPVLPKDSIHTAAFQHKNDTTAIEKDLIQFIEKQHAVPQVTRGYVRPGMPGKLAAFKQTLHYFKQHPLLLLSGTGIGNFSSKLAFRVTSMKVSGGYPRRFAYINKAFQANHLALYLYYFTNKDDFHSIANSPNSTYDQLISEYGLAGSFSFIVFYILFFTRQIKRSAYSVPLLLFMLGAFLIEYWFEQLSVIVLFELLMFLDTKETAATTNETK